MNISTFRLFRRDEKLQSDGCASIRSTLSNTGANDRRTDKMMAPKTTSTWKITEQNEIFLENGN